MIKYNGAGSCRRRHLQWHLRFKVYILPWLLLECHFGVVGIQLKGTQKNECLSLTHIPNTSSGSDIQKLKDTFTSGLLNQNDLTRILTHFISSSVNRRPVINMRRGMVRMSMKGSARDTGLDLTIHKSARHTIWMAVNKCIRPVFTCNQHVEILVT